MIKVCNLKKSFGNNLVLKGINYEINSNEKIVVIGPSGSGKSTFLRCLNLLETPTEGEVWFDGKLINDKKTDINEVRKHMGMVFQHFNLFNNKTILENITLAPVHHKLMSKEEANENALALLRRVGLEDKADDYPSHLSGGQKQRAAIARAIVNDPSFILADEPTGALDTKTSSEIMELFTELNKSGKTVIIITHDLTVADKCKRKIEISDGRII